MDSGMKSLLWKTVEAFLLASCGLCLLFQPPRIGKSCHALAGDGLWAGSLTWVSPACVQRSYTPIDTLRCLEQRKLLLVGNEPLQNIQKQVLSRLYQAIREESGGAIFWSNDSVTEHRALQNIEYIQGASLKDIATYEEILARLCSPDLGHSTLVIGDGAQYDASAQDYMKDLQALLQEAVDSCVEPAPSRQHLDQNWGALDTPFVLAPILPSHSNTTSMASLEPMNKKPNPVWNIESILVLGSFAKMSTHKPDRDDSDFPLILESTEVNILLNLVCNSVAHQSRDGPLRHCCDGYTPPNGRLIGSLMILSAILPGVVPALPRLKHWRWRLTASRGLACIYVRSVLNSIAVVYTVSTTSLLDQAQKLPFDSWDCLGMLFAALIAGIFSVRRLKEPPEHLSIPRQQIEEWKGWMQVVIMVYHYHEIGCPIWFWQMARVMVAAYLFICGFGQTMSYLTREDYSIARILMQLTRTNGVWLSLACVLGTGWTTYDFMPLYSYWYLLIYATLAMKQQYNKHWIVVSTKVLVVAILHHAFLDSASRSTSKLLALTTNTSVEKWQLFFFYVSRDRYAVFVGAFTGILLTRISKNSPSKWVESSIRKFCWCCLPLGLGLCTTFVVLTRHHYHTPDQWTQNQSWLAILPILGFFLVRNASSRLRSRCCLAFVWIGRHSGELYVLHKHLWLGGAQQAVLRTGLFGGDETLRKDRWRDMTITIPLCFAAATLFAEGTSALATTILRNPRASTGGHHSMMI